MKNTTFGDPKHYKVLIYITEYIEKLDRNQKEYLSSFIHDFNFTIRKTRQLKDEKTKEYLLKLIRDDYNFKLNKMINQHEDGFLTRLANYIHAKTAIN